MQHGTVAQCFKTEQEQRVRIKRLGSFPWTRLRIWFTYHEIYLVKPSYYIRRAAELRQVDFILFISILVSVHRAAIIQEHLRNSFASVAWGAATLPRVSMPLSPTCCTATFSATTSPCLPRHRKTLGQVHQAGGLGSWKAWSDHPRQSAAKKDVGAGKISQLKRMPSKKLYAIPGAVGPLSSAF